MITIIIAPDIGSTCTCRVYHTARKIGSLSCDRQNLFVVFSHFTAAGQKILDHLAKIQKMEQRVKDQEERDSATSSPAHQPSIERSDSSSSETRRRHSANRLQRQDVSVREGTRKFSI